jgi:hypothetical protein
MLKTNFIGEAEVRKAPKAISVGEAIVPTKLSIGKTIILLVCLRLCNDCSILFVSTYI